MADKTRGSKIKYRFLKKWRRPVAALLALAVLLGGICYRYFLFMSQTVYRESTSPPCGRALPFRSCSSP